MDFDPDLHHLTRGYIHRVPLGREWTQAEERR